MDNILIAREGYVYTNGETYSTVIRLGINDSAENWHEITDEESEKMLTNNLLLDVSVT